MDKIALFVFVVLFLFEFAMAQGGQGNSSRAVLAMKTQEIIQEYFVYFQNFSNSGFGGFGGGFSMGAGGKKFY